MELVQRADAMRNKAAIVDAAVECLGRDPDVSVAEIARAAGVGRVTLYGHYATRAELVDAAVVRALEQGETALSTVDLTGDPLAALTRLAASSWRLVARSRALLVAAHKCLPPGRIRELHSQPVDRVLRLITQGQRDGVFRDDLPATWLVAVMHSLMHGAADEVSAGRLDEDDAEAFLMATITATVERGETR